MKLREYRFESFEELNEVARCVLSLFKNRVSPSDIDYTPIVNYKIEQLYNLLEDRYDITPERLMMYLTCPIGVESTDDITNFGIRTNSNPSNGRINMHLTKVTLQRALLLSHGEEYDELYDKIIDSEEDIANTLPSSEDYLNIYAPSMLEETELLYYLFMTGRGSDFTEVYGDNEFLKKLEGGLFTGEEILDRMPEVKKGKRKSSVTLKGFVREDLIKISDGMKINVVPGEMELQPSNIILK